MRPEVVIRHRLCIAVKNETVPTPEDHSMGREERSLGLGGMRSLNGLPLQEMRRKRLEVRCAAAGGWPPALRVRDNRRWAGTVGGSGSTAGRAIRNRWSHIRSTRVSFLVASVKDCSGGPKLVMTVECGMGEFDRNKRPLRRRRPGW